jgi:hypothetical protein
MNLQVQCVSKTERMEGQDVVADVTLQPYNDNTQTDVYAQGAQVGTPNAPQQQPQAPELPKMILNGAFTLQIRDEEEAKKYSVGKVYTVNFGLKDVESTPKTSKTA